MKHILKDFLKTAQTQLFGKQEEIPRSGKLELTSNAACKMLAWGLDTETLKPTYEVGERVWLKEKDCWQITRKYQYYSVGLWYVEEWKPVKRTKDVEKYAR
jgi:hypothetical protein